MKIVKREEEEIKEEGKRQEKGEWSKEDEIK